MSKNLKALQPVLTSKQGPVPDEAVVFDMDNPRSVLRIAGDALREAILNLPEEYQNKSEKEFYMAYRPGAMENRLRLSFWREYESSQESMTQLNVKKVYAGLCTKEYFYQKAIKNPVILGWMLIPPTDYAVLIEEALTFGIQRLREIMELPLVDENGKVNVKLCDTIIRATAMLDMRIRGAYIQKSEVRQLNFNMNADAKGIGQALEASNMEEIERRIKYLESKGRAAAEQVEQAAPAEEAPSKPDIEVKALPSE